MSTRMQQRRGTADQWTIANPVLAEGEFGWESDTNNFKIGDGINNWSDLEYFQDTAAIGGSLEDYVPITELGVSVATLDLNGFVPAEQLDIDLSAYYTSAEVDSEISTAVAGLVDSAPGVLDTLSELSAAIGDDADFITTISGSVADAEQNAKDYADGLAANYDAVGSADTAEANANIYTDGEISTLDTSLKAYADQAEVDAVATSNAYTDSALSNIDVQPSFTNNFMLMGA